MINKIFSISNKEGKDFKIYNILTIFGIKFKFLNNQKTIMNLIKNEHYELKKDFNSKLNELYKLDNKIYNVSKIRTKNRVVNFSSFSDMLEAIRKSINILPENIDLIIGVPRSGIIPAYIIALYLNKNVCSLNEFLNEIPLQKGARNINNSEIKNILIVDDSTNSGKAMIEVKEKLLKSNIDVDKYNIKYCAIFATEASTHFVDYYFNIVERPRLFQWNYLNHNYAKHSCFDLDGVLCVNPTNDENDDDTKYLNFIQNAKPLYIPCFEINSIVTSRLEKYRKETEQWLKKHNVKYNKLFMLDLPDAETRRKLNCHANFKAEIFSKLDDCYYFVESDRSQAQQIANITGKQCFCVETDECFGG